MDLKEEEEYDFLFWKERVKKNRIIGAVQNFGTYISRKGRGKRVDAQISLLGREGQRGTVGKKGGGLVQRAGFSIPPNSKDPSHVKGTRVGKEGRKNL